MAYPAREQRVSLRPGLSEAERAPVLRGVGRPRRELVDTTPLTSAYGGVGPREAWLLRAARSRHPDPDVNKGATFRSLLERHGHRVSQASISRWESGDMQVPTWAPALYERALDLRVGSIQAPINGLRRSLTRHTGRPRPLLEVPQAEVQGKGLIQNLLRSDHTGHDWFVLAALTARGGGPLLPEDMWTLLVRRLTNEMCRSVGLAFTLRIEALATLISVPHVLPHVVRSIGDLVMDPESQALADAISLLEYVPGDRGTDLAIKLMHHERPGVQQAAAGLASIRIARGDVAPTRMGAMESAVTHVVSNSAVIDPMVVDLVNRLPRRSAKLESLMAAARATQSVQQVNLTGELVREDVAHLVTRTITHAAAEASRSGEPLTFMAQRLLRESLFNTYLDRRHQSSLLLMYCPWRDALADALADDLLTGADQTVQNAEIRVLTYVATPHTVPELARVACDLPELRGSALTAIAHTGSPIPANLPVRTWFEEDCDPQRREQLMYAMGMTRWPELEAIASSRGSQLNRYARWWLTKGAAVTV